MKALRYLCIAVAALAIFLFGVKNGFWIGDFPSRAPTAVGAAKATTENEVTNTSVDMSAQAVSSNAADIILFGDLHAHSSISLDAYNMTLPLSAGDGVHPVADACDFARYCSNLDFFSINDHAVNISTSLWHKTKESIRQCNALTDSDNPDLVAFLGYEWTQVGASPKNHYGHKNVIFLETDEQKVPTHPVAAKPPIGGQSEADFLPGLDQSIALPLIDMGNFSEYMAFNRYANNITAHFNNPCAVETAYDDLSADCMAQAETPAQLFQLLDEWGGDSLVIPHGNTWGSYTPFGVTWDKQLKGNMHDPERQKLIEIYSGHGNSESYRSWRHVIVDEHGQRACPNKTAGFYPGCRRAGDIIFEACMRDEITSSMSRGCKAKAAQARQDYLDSVDRTAFMSVPAASTALWQDAGQCTDCFLPTYELKPGGSAQYALAIRNFDDAEKPKRFDFSFIGSSDNHYARPGTGYKQFARSGMTEAWTPKQPQLLKMLTSTETPESLSSRVWRDVSASEAMKAGIKQFERQSSFFYTGGLVAAHSKSRKREDIWQALQQGHVYATSGDRTLLWFDLFNDAGEEVSMGGEAQQQTTPKFRVRAVGAFKQNPGCPARSQQSLAADELQRLCRGECYNPSDQRQRISRIEIVRIRPQNYQGEVVDSLIEDQWKVFICSGDGNGCQIEFDDPEFSLQKRDMLYYARVISEPKLLINGKSLNASYDADGKFLDSQPCDTSGNDDCLGINEPRAWSSPIFVSYGARP